ncbi:MAG: amino acid ABC transporter permease [Candidatus Babeliales bacterium]
MNFIGYIPLLIKGTAITFASWVMAGCISFSLGTLLGIISCRQIGLLGISMVIKGYVFIAKGIPAYVQILIAYFILPSLIGINISGFIAATIALAFCSSGYIVEITRAGINTISRGQWDACFVLGYSMHATLYRIIMPQVMRNVLPPLFGELEQLLKSTSLLATIGVTELTRTGMNIISRELNPLPVYLAIACIYLLFSAILQLILIYIEIKVNHDYR